MEGTMNARTLSLLLALVLATASTRGAPSPCPDPEPPSDKGIVGTWKLSQGAGLLGRGDLTFSKDGKLGFVLPPKTKANFTISATYKLTPGQLEINLDVSGKKLKRTMKILKMTDQEMTSKGHGK